jgi:MraZ protein
VVDIDFRKLLIPKDLISFGVSLRGRFSSAVNIVEIWDKDLYETSINGEDVDFADLRSNGKYK